MPAIFFFCVCYVWQRSKKKVFFRAQLCGIDYKLAQI